MEIISTVILLAGVGFLLWRYLKVSKHNKILKENRDTLETTLRRANLEIEIFKKRVENNTGDINDLKQKNDLSLATIKALQDELKNINSAKEVKKEPVVAEAVKPTSNKSRNRKNS